MGRAVRLAAVIKAAHFPSNTKPMKNTHNEWIKNRGQAISAGRRKQKNSRASRETRLLQFLRTKRFSAA